MYIFAPDYNETMPLSSRIPMRRTKLQILLSVFFLAFIFAACQDARQIKIGVSQCSGDAWHQQMNQGMKAEAVLHPNVSLDIADANYNNATQIKDIERMLEQGIDILIVSPNEAESLTPVIEKVYDSGIPVILVDSKINSDKYTTFIGTDNVQIGAISGHYVASRLTNGGKVAVIKGLEGSTSTTDREHGLDSILANFANIEIVAKMNGDWQTDLVFRDFGKILQEHPDIDVVCAQNDYMAIAAKSVADLLLPGNQIAFIGVDALSGPGLGVEAILNRRLNASIIYEPGGDVAIKKALAILEQDSVVDKEVLLPTNIIRGYNNALIMESQRVHIDEMNKKIAQLSDILTFSFQQAETQRVILFAFLIIVLLLIGVLFLAARLVRNRGRANNALQQQKEQMQVLSDQLKEATNAKMAFFTNVSHDLRTPLALITGPLAQLQKSKNIEENDKELLGIVQNNTFVLLGLINQLLDFRKYESGQGSLDISQFNIKDEVSIWLEGFIKIAPAMHINFESVFHDGDYTMNGDLQKIERIIYNLVANAFKFTPAGGSVKLETMEMSVPERTLRIAITDTGIGIGKKDIEKIFDSFYQSKEHLGGSGIGLAVVNSLVKLHKGIIRVESEEGKGSTFIVELPMDAFDLPSDINDEKHPILDRYYTQVSRDAVLAEVSVTNNKLEEIETISTDKPILLIVEDNQEMRTFIKMQLSDSFTIIEATNGKEGLTLAEKHIPDVILSDNMMPVMTGVEMCKKVKEKLQTSHIPVLMLTAYALDKHQLEAYNCGADGYLTKPFSTEVLIARINNLIENRAKLQELFKSTTVGVIVKDEDIKDMGNVDKLFIARLNEIIVKRMGDPDLNVEEIGQDIGLSRVQLYRKVKSITGQSPNELLRVARLKKAADLLSTATEMNITEIAYMVGFNSGSYFTKCYKDYFGVTPAETLKRSSNAGEQ